MLRAVLTLCSVVALSTVHASNLLTPIWTQNVPSTLVPPATASLGWSTYVDGAVNGSGYYATTAADHTLYVVSGTVEGSSIAWSFNLWGDQVPDNIAYQRSIVSAVSPSGEPLLLVLRGVVLHAFHLHTGAHIYQLNVSAYGTTSSTLGPIGDNLVLLQNEDTMTVFAAETGAALWSQALFSGADIRTGGVSGSFVVATAIAASNQMVVVAYAAHNGTVLWQQGYPASGIDFFFLFNVDESTITFDLQQQGVSQGAELVCRYAFSSVFAMWCVASPQQIWGYGIAGGRIYLQEQEPSSETLRIHTYSFATGDVISTTPVIPNATSGTAHIVGEPEYALLAYMQDEKYQLTGWRGSNGSKLFDFTVPVQSIQAQKSRRAALTRASQVGNSVVYSLVANYNGQVIVPSANGIFFVDGNAGAIEDNYSTTLTALVVSSIVLTSRVVVLAHDQSISAFLLNA